MRPTFRLVSDFIIPHLNKSTYGNHLQWEDEKNGSFKISRIHQSSDMWNEKCIEVYKAWSVKKNLWHGNDPKKITKAKHRLITALRRNPEIEMLQKESTYYRFRLVQPLNSEDRLYEENFTDQFKMHVMPKKINKEENYSISSEESKIYDVKGNIEIKKEQKDGFTFREANNNLSYCSLTHSEFHDIEKIFPLTDIFEDEISPSDTKTTVISDKCCCEKLLDNYLCNQKCIWHGMPP